VVDRFPDGQLFVNLRGYPAGQPMPPIEVLARFLHALGTPAPEVPADVDEAATLYRSLLAGKRALVLLDNAAHPDQVRPLLPGSPGCVVLVTSRDQLGGLVARDGAVAQTLDVLGPAEAHTLLGRVVGADRVAGEPAAVAELAALCGYLPLALRIAGANLATNPASTVAGYTAVLAGGDRLAALQIEGDPHAAVRVAFDHSYAALPDGARRLFRLLGLVPGPHFTPAVAAALTGTAIGPASELLDRLAAAHLVGEQPPGRYGLHDLLRRYAAEQCGAEDGGPEREAALARLYGHYLAGAAAAAGHLYPEILRLPGAGAAPSPFAGIADDVSARAWLDAERPNLVAAVLEGAGHGLGPVSWRLADALRGYFYLGMHVVDWRPVAEAALAAARAHGDSRAQAAAHLSLASLHWVQGRHMLCVDQQNAALALARKTGWAEGELAALGNLGNLYWALGRLGEAADHYKWALDLSRRTGQEASAATALGNLGLVHFDLGQLDDAARFYTEALDLQRRIGSRSGEGRILLRFGETYHGLGRLDEALPLLTEALALHRAVGDRNIEGDTLRALAAVHRDAGRLDEALDVAGAALDLALDSGDRRLEAGALTTRASVLLQRGQGRGALDAYQRAVNLTREVGNRSIEAEALIGLAAAHRHEGNIDAAAACARSGLSVARQGLYRMLEGEALTALATVELDRGEVGQAADHAEQALAIHTGTGHRLCAARARQVADRALSANADR
jgi:tetratricopeptide (TPR) repeat protein